MGKWYLFNVYTFCKSLCVINKVSPYGLHGVPVYILYLYDHMWLVGNVFQNVLTWIKYHQLNKYLRINISCQLHITIEQLTYAKIM